MAQRAALKPAKWLAAAQRVLIDVIAPCANALCGAAPDAARKDGASGAVFMA